MSATSQRRVSILAVIARDMRTAELIRAKLYHRDGIADHIGGTLLALGSLGMIDPLGTASANLAQDEGGDRYHDTPASDPIVMEYQDAP
jgi:hypothetical protein